MLQKQNDYLQNSSNVELLNNNKKYTNMYFKSSVVTKVTTVARQNIEEKKVVPIAIQYGSYQSKQIFLKILEKNNTFF